MIGVQLQEPLCERKRAALGEIQLYLLRQAYNGTLIDSSDSPAVAE